MVQAGQLGVDLQHAYSIDQWIIYTVCTDLSTGIDRSTCRSDLGIMIAKKRDSTWLREFEGKDESCTVPTHISLKSWECQLCNEIIRIQYRDLPPLGWVGEIPTVAFCDFRYYDCWRGHAHQLWACVGPVPSFGRARAPTIIIHAEKPTIIIPRSLLPVLYTLYYNIFATARTHLSDLHISAVLSPF